MSITKTHEVFSLPNVHYALFRLYGIAWKNMVEMGRGGACVPARVALLGRIHRYISRAQCVYFLAWKHRYADVRAGTQAPPLRILLERVVHGCTPLRFRLADCACVPPLHISFGQIACGCRMVFLLDE